MDFTLSDEQQHIRAAVTRLCADFAAGYWLEKDTEGGFPHEFYAAMAGAGWLGGAMPAGYGGGRGRPTPAAPRLGGGAPPGGGVFCRPRAPHQNLFPPPPPGFCF